MMNCAIQPQSDLGLVLKMEIFSLTKSLYLQEWVAGSA
jgi:hypothetical protein